MHFYDKLKQNIGLNYANKGYAFSNKMYEHLTHSLSNQICDELYIKTLRYTSESIHK